MEEIKEVDHARDQAKAQAESISNIVARLKHVRECEDFEDHEECGLTDKEIFDGLNLLYNEGDTANDVLREEYHDAEIARERIQEDPLSVEIRSGWYTPGEEPEPNDFAILLCTGGPAVRIRGELDQHKQPRRAWLEYQDWGTPWTRYFDVEQSTLLAYCQEFYFGE